MGTYVTTWSCKKCGLTIPTRQVDAGFLYGYGCPKPGHCPCGGEHEWYELTEGHWE